MYFNVMLLSYSLEPATTHCYGAPNRIDAPHESHLRADSSVGHRIDVVVSEDSPAYLAAAFP